MTRFMQRLLGLTALFSIVSFSDTPPPRSNDSNTFDYLHNGITSDVVSTKRGLHFYGINPVTDPLKTSLVFSGTVIDPRVISGTVSVSNLASSGLATFGAQTTIISSLSSINSKIPSGLTVSGDRLKVTTDFSGSLSTSQGSPNSLSNAWPVKISDGTVSNSFTGTSLNVNVTGSALPSGAATSALQTSGNSSLSSIASTLSTLNSKVPSGLTVSGDSLKITGNVTTPLPSGAATEAKQDDQIDEAQISNGFLADIVFSTDSIDSKLTSPLSVSGSSVSVSSSALPSGASTSANQSTQITEAQTTNATLSSIDDSLISIDSKISSPLTVTATDLDIRNLIFASDKVDVTGSSVAVTASALPSGASTSANQVLTNSKLDDLIAFVDSIDSKTVHVDTDNVTVVSSALPTGAATSALQTSGNASLSSINSNLDVALSTRASASNQTNGTASTRLNDAGGDVANITGTSLDVNVTSSALPSGAATSSNQSTIIGHVDGVEGLLGTSNANTGATASSTASIDSKLTTTNTSLSSLETRIGAITETPAASDTDSVGLNGLFKRLLQKVTTFSATLSNIYTSLIDGSQIAREYVVEDDANSTDIALTSGSIFYGPWTERIAPEIMMSPQSDRNFTWYAQFANTELSTTPATPVYTAGAAAGIDSSLSYSYTAGAVNTPRRLVNARKWYRIVIVNDSGSNMSTLRFQTSVGRFAALSSKLDSQISTDAEGQITRSFISGFDDDGATQNARISRARNLGASIYDANSSDSAIVTQGGALNTESRFQLVGGFFEGTSLNTNFWTSTLATGGTVTVANAAADLTTTATSGSSSQVDSVSRGRFIVSNVNEFITLLKTSDGATGTSNNVKEWGAWDDNNGFRFRQNGTAFEIVTRRAGVDTAIDSSLFNGLVPVTRDANFHRWTIRYAPLRVEFFQDEILIHTIMPTTTLLTGTFHLPIRFKNSNTGASSATTMTVDGSSIFRIGNAEQRNRSYFETSTGLRTIKSSAGRVVRLVLNRTSGGLGGTTTVDLYDSATASATNQIGSFQMTGAGIVPIELGVETNNGITINNSSANMTVTVIYN